MNSRASVISIALVLSLPFILQAFLAFAKEPEVKKSPSGLTGEFCGGNIAKDLHLSLEDDGRFVFEKHDDKTDIRYIGNYRFNKNRLTLTPNNEQDFPLGKSFIVCKWDSTTVLIAKNQIIDFCNDINQGRNGSRFALRSDEWLDNLKVKPDLPKKYKKYLLPKILRGEVIKLQGKKTAVINLGMNDGLLPKLTLLTFRTDEEIMEGGEVTYTHQIRSARVIECFKDKSIILYPKDNIEFEIGQEVFSRLTLYKK